MDWIHDHETCLHADYMDMVSGGSTQCVPYGPQFSQFHAVFHQILQSSVFVPPSNLLDVILVTSCLNQTHWRIQGTPPGVQILSFSCSFRQKNVQNTPTSGVGAPSGKSWIGH